MKTLELHYPMIQFVIIYITELNCLGLMMIKLRSKTFSNILTAFSLNILIYDLSAKCTKPSYVSGEINYLFIFWHAWKLVELH